MVVRRSRLTDGEVPHTTGRKVAASIPDEAIGFFNWPNPSSGLSEQTSDSSSFLNAVCLLKYELSYEQFFIFQSVLASVYLTLGHLCFCLHILQFHIRQ
jgi:hypothetical protein